MRDRCEDWSRRQFVGGLTRVVTAGLLGLQAEQVAAEPPPETTRIRLANPGAALCFFPQFAAEELLRAEGFTDIQYVRRDGTAGIEELLAAGEADLTMNYVLRWVVRLDAGDPVTLLAGVHTGCTELFVGSRVRSVRDLKGKTIANSGGEGQFVHQLTSVVLAQLGLDPRKDVQWVFRPASETLQLFTEGKVDALLGFPPAPQELRTKGVGRVLLDTGRDRPWSQYFCCMLAANRDFHRKHPIAAKRAMRAILKTADLCSLDPDMVARRIVDRGFAPNYDYARQTAREVGYRAWRTLDPDDAVRFFALRLHENGFIKASPKRILESGTDWRLFNELRRELKG